MLPLHLPKSTIKAENSTSIYLRDFYIKDFKYISPEILQAKILKEPKANNYFKKNGDANRKSFIKTWLKEVMKGLKQFLYEGSLHGVKYIFEPTLKRKEHATWIIIVVVSVLICAVYIIQLFCKWTSSPFVNVIDSLATPVWTVPFPTVVLCPHLHVQLSFANISELNNLEKFFASLICPRMSNENATMKHRLKPDENRLLQEFINKGSPKCEDVVKSCYWRSNNKLKWMTKECCEMFFQPVYTNYGLCFAFNSLPLNGMTNKTWSWQKAFNINATPKNFEWGLDSGYPKAFPPDTTMPPFRVMGSGEMNGLGVELYLNITEHQYDCDGNSFGFNLLISAPTDHMYTSTVLRLPMDKMTTIEVSPITYKTDTSLRSLTPDRRQCFFQNERKLEYYEFYTDSNCKHDLLIRETKKICHCVLYNWPRKHIWEPICSTAADYRCVVDILAKVEEQLIYAYYADCEEQRQSKTPSTSCHPSCNDILYNSRVFYSDLSKAMSDTPLEWGAPKLGEVTRINVHFYDDIFLGQHRHAQYDDYYFIGAIGGLLSLFMGFSIISVAELVYFVIFRPLLTAVKKTYYRNK